MATDELRDHPMMAVLAGKLMARGKNRASLDAKRLGGPGGLAAAD